MRKTFVIVSVSDRVDALNDLVRSIMRFEKFKDYDICLCFQDYLGNSKKIKYTDRYKKIIIKPERMGCHGARVCLLKEISYDYYINLDDDMELVEQTDYSRAIEKASEKGTGFVITNWARNMDILESKIPKMQDKFVPQIMVYQGGGMVYSERVASLIRKLPIQKTMFDDAWSIQAYINGLTNFRYLGSLAVHSICSSGGMKAFMREENPPLACNIFINYRKGKRKNEWLIPLDKDVNGLARHLHKINKVT